MISIIVPVYNVEKYLKQCVESIENQTYANWELILVDDGSTDGSLKLCDDFALANNKIRVVHSKNYGVSTARNIGLKEAKGDFIAFVDGDDWIEETMCEKLFAKMSENTDIVFCRFTRDWIEKKYYCYESNLINLCNNPWLYQDIIFDFGEETIGNKKNCTNIFGSVCRCLFRKSLITENGVHFLNNIQIAEDRLFLLSYLNYCHTAELVDEYLYHYRSDREGSATTSNTKGYMHNFYTRQKNILVEEFQIIDSNALMSQEKKSELKKYEYAQFCLNLTVNEVLNNKSYAAELNRVFGDSFFKKAIDRDTFVLLTKMKVNFRRKILYLLIKFHWWRVIHFVLKNR